MSGRYIEVYKGPRALYTNLTQSFIYFETVSKLRRGKKMSIHKETETMARWHEYSAKGGSADFEVFYAHSKKNQKLLVRVARGKALLRSTL